MLLIVVFTVIMVMMGDSPMDKWRKEQEKYGKDPLAREINKFNEEQGKHASGSGKYTPPPGATVYRLPQSEAVIVPSHKLSSSPGEEDLVRPAPDIPPEQWDSGYPAHMMAPQQGTKNEVMAPGKNSGTSLIPGRAPQ